MTLAKNESFSKDDDTVEKWTNLDLGGNSVRVSNPTFPIPKGMEIIPDFLTDQEASSVLNELDAKKWQREGFEQKRRVQRYNKSNLPSSLQPLFDRIVSTVHRRPQQVVIEEYPSNISQMHLSTNWVVTSFESLPVCEKESRCDCCFVAQVALLTPSVQHMNCPIRREPECWTLASPEHWTDIWMEPQALVVKSGESLWAWRSRVAPPLDSGETHRVVLVKFYSLPSETVPVEANTEQSVSQVPRPLFPIMPPLEDILTIIVTTSPIRSNPDTEMLEKTFESFRLGGDDFCYTCRKVIICDGCRVLDTNKDSRVSLRHSNVKQALRNGIATTPQVECYKGFKENLRALCENATPDSPFWNTSVEELQERHGYGFALRHALRHCVTTPFVCVIQHDRTFMRPTPIRDTVHAMWNNSNVKYVGMSMRSNLLYRDIFQSKYGKAAYEELADLILRLPELALDASMYGPDGRSCREIVCLTEGVRKSTAMLAQTYKKSNQCLEQEEWLKSHPTAPGLHQLTLTPTLFWYDNTHICDTAHYRDFIFDPRYQMVARGGFVEDKLSPNIAKSVERLGLAEGHARYGCYLLDDHSGTFFTGHLDGGSYWTEKQREKFCNDK